MASGPEEAESPAEAADTAAGGAGEHATGHQAAPAEEAERNDNDPLDGASEETRNAVRMATTKFTALMVDVSIAARAAAAGFAPGSNR